MKQLRGPPVTLSRRDVVGKLATLGVLGLSWAGAAHAATANGVELPFVNGHRDLTTRFPEKGAMILQRTRPPLLETPFEVFGSGVFTPNDRFYVRWHLANIPTVIDPAVFRLKVRGHVQTPLSLTLESLTRDFQSVEMAAVNQCSGNSRGFFEPRVAGGEWAHGAMGNALWTGVRLKDVLDRAGVKSGAVDVRFNGLDTGLLPETPDFIKSLAVDHARDGEVMIAYAMNGKPLPLLNGYPLRLVVPGWYATYWVKMLDDIEVLEQADDNFWMKKAYLIPDTPFADIVPGQTGFKLVPINRMLPRSFITNVQPEARLQSGRTTRLQGIAFGGDTGIKQVLVSLDEGREWREAQLGADHGKYSFRRWDATIRIPAPGARTLRVKAVNTDGVAQPERANWNGSGFMRNVVESIAVLGV